MYCTIVSLCKLKFEHFYPRPCESSLVIHDTVPQFVSFCFHLEQFFISRNQIVGSSVQYFSVFVLHYWHKSEMLMKFD